MTTPCLEATIHHRDRLNLQHFLWTQEFGYLIHPSIAIAPPSNPTSRIADIGTGTGIWLLDLARTLPSPSVQLDGFDTDLSLMPLKEWLPGNVQMRKWDVYDALPPELVGKYDVVHVRFFLCVVRDGDPRALLRKFMMMLKPGGYIQWTEQDLATCRITSAASSNIVTQTQQLQNFALSPTPKWPSTATRWVAGLARMFEEEGLRGVVEDRRQESGPQLPYWYDVTLLALEEMAGKLVNGVEVRAMIRKAVQECKDSARGVAIISDQVTFIGMKA